MIEMHYHQSQENLGNSSEAWAFLLPPSPQPSPALPLTLAGDFLLTVNEICHFLLFIQRLQTGGLQMCFIFNPLFVLFKDI